MCAAAFPYATAGFLDMNTAVLLVGGVEFSELLPGMAMVLSEGVF